MTKFVSYVSDEAIEKDAQALLAEYAHARGVPIEAPIAIDDIIEKHLKIGIEFDDTHRLFGVPRSGIGFDPDILGAIFFEQKRIVIDESLDPDENPAKEGRYRYTAAHEVGHWRLHRHLFGKDPAQTSMLDGNAPPSVICRTSQAKARIELQADLYASCVLMPRKLVFAAWDEAFPDRKQRVLQPSQTIDHHFVELARFELRMSGTVAFSESDNEALEAFAKPFAEKFLVSPIAMRIRLEKLALLHRTVPLQRLLSDGA
jgi:Zn-dependent peptidase ImmA (M78 family)